MMKLFKTKFTEADNKIKDIVETFLANKETVIDINPEDMSYLISYERFNYYLLIDSVGVQISNHKFAKDMRLEDAVINVLKDMAFKETVIRRTEKRKLIFKNNVDLLDAIVKDVAMGIPEFPEDRK
jgi:hypothetical protein